MKARRDYSESARQFIKTILRYEKDTGLFYWINSRGNMKAGEVAGFVDARGYIQVSVNCIHHKGHHLAFVFMDQEMPEYVDHINGIKTDNRWENLRPSSNGQNQMNRPVQLNNKLGVKGVRIDRSGKYSAQVQLNGKRHYATFNTLEEADAWAKAKREELHGEYARH